MYQHKSSHLVVVTSYTWKAADLISTSHNPGVSSTTTFGINPYKVRKTPGERPTCKSILNESVVMVLNDEISFTHQSHMLVSLILVTLMYLDSKFN